MSRIIAGDAAACLSSVSFGLVTGMHFFPLQAKGNSGGVISQMWMSSGNVGVNKADLDLAMSPHACNNAHHYRCTLLHKEGSLTRDPSSRCVCGCHKNSPLAALTCRWMSGRSKKQGGGISSYQGWFPQRIVRIPRPSVVLDLPPEESLSLTIYECTIVLFLLIFGENELTVFSVLASLESLQSKAKVKICF